MKAEEEISDAEIKEFVDGQSDDVCERIQKAISRRIEMKNAKNHPTPTQTKYAAQLPTTGFSISSLACQCKLCVTNVPGYSIPSTTQEAPPQMGQRNDTMSDLDTARRHMDNRLYSIKRTKRDALKTQFGLSKMERPKTYAEMKDRLTAGKFLLPEDDTDYAMDLGISLDNLEWRDPAVKKDRPGFEAAEKLLDASATKVKDAIWVKTNPEDALAALEAFESSTVN